MASKELVDKRPYELLIKELADIAVLERENGFGFSIAAEVVDNIMSADSVDEIFAANEQGPADIEDYLNVPISVGGLAYFKSQEKYRENGLGVYVVMDAITDLGEAIKLSTGAPNVVASMRALQKLGKIREDEPLRLSITGKETANGTLYRVGRAA